MTESGVPARRARTRREAASPADPATTQFYDRYATEVVQPAREPARSGVARHFEQAFAPGTRVLDVGCGSGRDLALLRALGCDAWGVEPNATLRELAAERHPDLQGRLAAASLPHIGQPFGGGFGGVVCSAVLMHLPAAELGAALRAMGDLLVPRGRLLLSWPEMRDDVLQDGRDPDGRLFTNHAPALVRSRLEALGVARIAQWDADDVLAQTGTRWITQLFES